MTPLITVSPYHDALIVVDMQNDFVRPDGALPVPAAMEVIPVINDICNAHEFRVVVVTHDWHPPGHCSFRAPEGPGGPWPAHCVKGTEGAALHPLLRLRGVCHTLYKETDIDTECYSGFADENGVSTGLAKVLREMGVNRVFICGVAFDFCVYYTALGALNEGFEVFVLEDATRAVFVNLIPERQLTLQSEGAKIVNSGLLTHKPADDKG